MAKIVQKSADWVLHITVGLDRDVDMNRPGSLLASANISRPQQASPDLGREIAIATAAVRNQSGSLARLRRTSNRSTERLPCSQPGSL